MGIGPIACLAGLAGSCLQSLIPSSHASSTARASDGTPDANGLSPFARILGGLQALQQSNPARYQQLTRQISTNLETAARTATSQGENNLAGGLARLSNSFQSASSSGQPPNARESAQAVGGHRHHHGVGASARLSFPRT
jgi:hypothetical protein